MKKATITFLMAILVMGVATLNAQGQGQRMGGGFVDVNGDGVNDNAADLDGDGIPNGLDDDFVQNSGTGQNFIDEDGDGINDNALDDDNDGIINCEDDDYVRPESGQGRGRGLNNDGSFVPEYRKGSVNNLRKGSFNQK